MTIVTRLKSLCAETGRRMALAAVFVAYGIGLVSAYVVGVASFTGLTMAATASSAQAHHRRRWRHHHHRHRHHYGVGIYPFFGFYDDWGYYPAYRRRRHWHHHHHHHHRRRYHRRRW